MAQQHFEEEVKRKIVALHVEGRTIKSLADEYKVSKARLSNWVKQYRSEGQTNQDFTAVKINIMIKNLIQILIILHTSGTTTYAHIHLIMVLQHSKQDIKKIRSKCYKNT